MRDFVELWVYLAATPLFGLTATLVTYLLAHAVSLRLEHPPWANPVLWTVVALALLLTASSTPYPTYFSGAQFIHFLLGPAVVALAWPLWQRRAQLRGQGLALLGAGLAGGLAAALSAVGLGWALGLPEDVLRSLAPKSVTAPVAMGIAEQLVGRAGGGAEAAMHALAQDGLGRAAVGRALVLGGELGLHGVVGQRLRSSRSADWASGISSAARMTCSPSASPA